MQRYPALALALILAGCTTAGTPPTSEPRAPDGRRYLSQPLISSLYTADPSAHVFDGRIWIYPSHDINGPTPEDDLGSHFEMRDYHVLSMERIGGRVTDHGVALKLEDVPWAARQLWAPDAAYKNGRYYLYFPAKDRNDVFHIGVATATRPQGPFTAQPQPIPGSFSIDPAVFTDGDGESYMYFGGIWGGQLQRWATGRYDANGSKTDLGRDDAPALAPKVARMSADMLRFAEAPRDVTVQDEAGRPLTGGDHDRRFFEASWMHKRGDTYYFSYSTGDTHFLNYATGTSPYGPFTYRGHLLLPVQGWTTHHSITQVGDRWYLFYADTQLSNDTRLRNVKVTELFHNPDGSIRTIDPFVP